MLDWLEPWLADVPESLRSRIVYEVERRQELGGSVGKDGGAGDRVQNYLRRIGEDLMKEAKSAPPTRDTAMTLLAADALITYACEVLAERKPENLADAWSAVG